MRCFPRRAGSASPTAQPENSWNLASVSSVLKGREGCCPYATASDWLGLVNCKKKECARSVEERDTRFFSTIRRAHSFSRPRLHGTVTLLHLKFYRPGLPLHCNSIIAARGYPGEAARCLPKHGPFASPYRRATRQISAPLVTDDALRNRRSSMSVPSWRQRRPAGTGQLQRHHASVTRPWAASLAPTSASLSRSGISRLGLPDWILSHGLEFLGYGLADITCSGADRSTCVEGLAAFDGQVWHDLTHCYREGSRWC